jgi:hypothetical protein
MTCSASGLSIGGGTPVRCLLMTKSPYGDDGRDGGWLLRTPPLRAEYNSYGSIENVHVDDRPIAELWLRGLWEDLVELGQGDNSIHDVPTARGMTFEELLGAIRVGRVLVRQDVKTFWRGSSPRDQDKTLVQRVRETLEAGMPGTVSSQSEPGKYVVDEPVPNLIRIRFGKYLHGKALMQGLERAQAIVERASFIGAITAGSGRYADEADLLVFLRPGAHTGTAGPQWDMVSGATADEDRRLAVSMVMIREDVWQALIAYPHKDLVSLPCTTCGQMPWYHESGRICPTKKINEHDENHYKEHAPGTTYSHGPVLDEGVEHRIVATEWTESVWYGISAYRAGVRRGWSAIVRHFVERNEPKTEMDPLWAQEDQKFLDVIQAHIEEERERVAALPEAERLEVEAKNRAEAKVIEAEHLRKRLNPRFSDFPIRHGDIDRDDRAIGCWIMQESAPGVVGIPEHLSMILADRSDPGEVVLDAIAELAAVRRVLGMVGVPIRPATSSGPQYAEWPEFVRFHRTLLAISEAEVARTRDGVSVAPSTLAEVVAGSVSP